MLGRAGFSFQSAAVRMMFPRAKVLKEKETYAFVIFPHFWPHRGSGTINQMLSIGMFYISFEMTTSGWRDGGVKGIAF
jgi:hypothetical protein